MVGGNLTAIEAATEIAESRPELRVSLATSGELGGWLGAKARRQLVRAFDRFGITVHEHTPIERVEATAAVAVDGTVFVSDATVWAAVSPSNRSPTASGLAVEPNGQITVDRQMRSVSHPDVYVAGDSAFVIGDNGRPLPMSCASAGVTSMQATAAIIGDRTGRAISTTSSWSYVGNHISLGRRDGLFQLVDGDARSKSMGPAWPDGGARQVGNPRDCRLEHCAVRPLEGRSHAYRLATTREHSPRRCRRIAVVLIDTADVARFEASRNRLASLAYRLLGSAADAEDTVQDAFLRGRPPTGSTSRCPRRG